MAALLELSHELLHCIFTEVDPVDLAALYFTCRSLNAYIRGNLLLHKELYLRRYDGETMVKSSSSGGDGETDWIGRVHTSTRLEKVLAGSDVDKKRDELAFVAEHLGHLLDTANASADESKNISILRNAFFERDGHETNSNVFLCSSSLWREAGTSAQQPARSPELRQLSAKLHCLYGKPIEPVKTRSFERPSYTRLRFIHGDQTIDFAIPPAASTRRLGLVGEGGAAGPRPDIASHMVARAKVYDLREYTDGTLWGPFVDDGTQRVDWEKMEAVMIVLGYNMRKFHDRTDGRFGPVWDEEFVGATPFSYAPPLGETAADGGDEANRSPSSSPSAENSDSSDSPAHDHHCSSSASTSTTTASTISTSTTTLNQDPKNMDDEIRIIRELVPGIDSRDPFSVTGTWMRVVCFLDYNDLYRINFSNPHQARAKPLAPIDIEEAIRLIRIKLQVTRVEPPGSGDEGEDEAAGDGMDWSAFKGERLPVVHFRGSSRSLHASWDPNANSRIRGTVRQTPEGEIRWTTFSIFHGEERWRSEGIQVGGLRSARGVLGNWFDKDFDMHGPAGPTAFWKESDNVEEDRPGNWLPH